MIRTAALALLLALAGAGMAQTGSAGKAANNSYDTPFDKTAGCNNYAIKFKVLPWISLPEGEGLNFSAGYEYGFSKNQSIGVDLYYNRYSFASADRYDSAKQEYEGGPRQLSRDKAIFVNYRYYLNSSKARQKDARVWYLGSFMRYGRIKFKYDEDYSPEEKSNVVKEDHYSIGGMFGFLQQIDQFKNGRQIYLDLYFGVFVKQKVQYIQYVENNSLVKDKDYPMNLGFRIGLTLSLVFERKAK